MKTRFENRIEINGQLCAAVFVDEDKGTRHYIGDAEAIFHLRLTEQDKQFLKGAKIDHKDS